MANKKNEISKDIKKGKEKVYGFFGEFKKFIQKGNVFDLAIGVIIGGAFSKIVSSLVNDILMPLLGLVIGGNDFKSLAIKINSVPIHYGSFIQNVVDFLLVAFLIFIFIKISNNIFKSKKAEEKKPVAAPVKSDEVILLEEIRDLLKKQK